MKFGRLFCTEENVIVNAIRAVNSTSLFIDRRQRRHGQWVTVVDAEKVILFLSCIVVVYVCTMKSDDNSENFYSRSVELLRYGNFLFRKLLYTANSVILYKILLRHNVIRARYDETNIWINFCFYVFNDVFIGASLGWKRWRRCWNFFQKWMVVPSMINFTDS